MEDVERVEAAIEKALREAGGQMHALALVQVLNTRHTASVDPSFVIAYLVGHGRLEVDGSYQVRLPSAAAAAVG